MPSLTALMFLLAFPAALWSQSTGTVTGQVRNAATGVNLQGAIVRVQDTGIQASTNRDGSYRLTAPTGTQTLEVSYTGLDPQTATVTVAAGQPTQRNFGLTAEIYQLAEVNVSGEREGNALAITLQRQAPNVKNVVSADAFGSLAGNPADLLMRLPGVVGESVGGDTRYVQIRGMNQDLNTITVDGNRMADAGSAGTNRHFQFQGIGSDMIERIEVTKAPTPDMDADSIGGAVNMVTKSAFDRTPERRINFSVGGIWRVFDERDEFRPNYTIGYSEVFGDRLGVSLNYGHRAHGSVIDIGYTQREFTLEDPAYVWFLRAQDFRNVRTRWGGNLRLDYKVSDQTRFFFNTTMNKHTEHANHTRADMRTSRRVAKVENGEFVGNGAIFPDYTSEVTEWRPLRASTFAITSQSAGKNAESFHHQIGGVHDFNDLEIDYDVYKSDAETAYPLDGGGSAFTMTARNVGMRIEQTGEPFFPDFSQTSGSDIHDINSYTDNRLQLRDTLGEDSYWGAALNVKKHFDAAVPTWLKAGLRLRKQTRDLRNDRFRYTYVGPDGVEGVNEETGINDDNLAQFVMPDYNYDLDGRYPNYPNLPFAGIPDRNEADSTDYYSGFNVTDSLRENPELWEPDISYNISQKLRNRRNFEETVSGAYLMGNVELGRLTMLGGFRVEQTETWGEGARIEITPEEQAIRDQWELNPANAVFDPETGGFRFPLTEEEQIRRVTAENQGRFSATGEYKKVFPGLHLKYEPLDSVVMRASWSTNIGRPNIGTLIPTTSVDYDDEIVVSNNPSLEPQYADNFDASVEYYFEPVGLLSAGVFLKEIKDFIFTDSGQVIGSGPDNGFNGLFEGYTLRTQANGGSAKVRGFELAYQQQFTFLPGFWQGFGVFANYTRLESEGDYGGSTERTSDEVADFIPESGNLGISYIRGGISVRFQLNHNGRYLDSFSSNLSRQVYRRARTALDVKTKFALSRKFDLYLDVVNVFAEGDRVQEYRNGRARLIHKMGPQFFVGINGRL